MEGGSWIKAAGAAAVSLVADKVLKPMKAVRDFGAGRNYKNAAKPLTKKAGQERLKSNIKKSVVSVAISRTASNVYNWVYDKLPPKAKNTLKIVAANIRKLTGWW